MESSEQPSEARGDIEPHQKSPGEATPPAASGVPAWVKIAAVVSLLVGAVGYLIFGSSASDAFVYSKLVDEVMAKPGRRSRAASCASRASSSRARSSFAKTPASGAS